ncbi:grasp-with-spasm system SPASM domain peptide maturase [Polaribacter sp. 11A2H]|uniref:grasp-with-spasm system SPASM domain peptide maturase n=1 Tax=Polaribacter sp. 11A2H TaxID=2687290 RepID=UPI001408C6C7|nr:grasp-with-spasm system SPASM domain peptide maturase [Polaribacter sp. 11A2H]
MIEKKKYFKFHSSCVPVKGQKRGVIYDLQRGTFYFVPNSIIDILVENSKNKIESLFLKYPTQEELVEKYLKYLIENELIFLVNDLNHFPEIETNFDRPFLLDILFIELDSLSKSKIKVLEKINELGCTQLIIITYKIVNIDIIKKVIDLLSKSKIQVINLITKYNNEICSEILEIHNKSPRLRETIFFESPQDINDNYIKFTKKNLKNVLTKRITNINDLIINQDAYFESLKYNLFFNRKIYITNSGEIKHYFNDTGLYGNIKYDEIQKVVNSDNFQNLWNIRKVEVEECKNCEFRYLCPDNRIPIRENNIFLHQTSCSYDPKEAKWN